MGFKPSASSPGEIEEPVYWFAFQNNKLLVSMEDNKARIPKLYDLDEMNIQPVRTQYLGLLNGIRCYSAELPLGMLWPENMSFLGLLELFGVLDEEMFSIVVNAIQIVNWDQTHQYCGRCGTQTETKPDERAKVCPQCNQTCFPRLTPAIMVAIIKENQILLANNSTFPSGFFSVLAGFVEPGETLEECVSREVKEEVGLEVQNITYFNSQPWPFPDSLMIAYTAEYAGGDIVVDGKEIAHAEWFTADNLPKRPAGNLSIAGRIIDWFQENY